MYFTKEVKLTLYTIHSVNSRLKKEKDKRMYGEQQRLTSYFKQWGI